MCQKTIKENNLSDRVKVYLSDSLKNILITEEGSWNLVIGNPPHSGTGKDIQELMPNITWTMPSLLYKDENWENHRSFYNNIGKFIKKDANIIIQENSDWSSVFDFKEMIEINNLSIKQVLDCQSFKYIYYIWSKLR